MKTLQQFLIGLIITGLLFLPIQTNAQPAQGQKARPNYITNPSLPTPGPNGSNPTPSPAVIQTTQNQLVLTVNHIQAGSETSADLAASASALQVMFANWEESGENAAIQSDLNASGTVIAGYTGITNAQATTLYNNMYSAGATSLTENQVYNQLSSVTPAQLQAFYKQYAVAGGIEALEATIVSGMQQASASMNNTVDPSLRFAKFQGRAHLQNVGHIMTTICVVSGGIGLYAAVVALACIPCAPIAGGVALVGAFVAFVTC